MIMKAGTKVGIGIALVAAAIVIAGNFSDQNATTESIKDNTSERITDTQITQPLSKPIQTTQPSCDPSYPDVCIPPYPPDLNCGDILHKNFRVVGEDMHGFDGNKDGIGCKGK